MEGGRDSGESNDGRPAPGLSAGLVLDGRYRILRPLAEGGMGAVWVAQQISLEREVAIKVLHVADDAQRARLRREALALAAVCHPAVVQVYDYGETTGGIPYAVMELVRGPSLGAHLRRVGALPAEEAVALVLPLLEGLSAAHGAGVIYRDIKPENVVLAEGPAGVAPRLLDFGIARRPDPEDARLTADGSLMGTPAYMAPEQVRGADPDERVDVWGMAVLLYELIAGVTPFAAGNVFVVMRGVVDNPPPFPRHAVGLDGRLWAILMAALRKVPEERTPSALALRDALAVWLGGRRNVLRSLLASAASGASGASEAPVALAARFAPTLAAAGEGEGAAPAPPEDASPSFDALIREKLGGR